MRPWRVISPQFFAAHDLLHHHPRDADHRQTPVVQLLGLHVLESSRILRLKIKRVKAHVPWRMITSDRPDAARRGVVQVIRSLEREHGNHLVGRDGQDDSGPEGLQRRLLECHVRWDIDLSAPQRVKVLGHGKADGGEHRHTRVLDLNLSIEAQGSLRLALGKGRGVPKAERSGHSSQFSDVELRLLTQSCGFLCCFRHSERGGGCISCHLFVCVNVLGKHLCSAATHGDDAVAHGDGTA
mmetsp:Transcript_26209/g.44708  ORF Transcript_26209/g.44708 Transcript_26209/m.44708 type:complete len:240 (-) Transcript_26209:89-808(-)